MRLLFRGLFLLWALLPALTHADKAADAPVQSDLTGRDIMKRVSEKGFKPFQYEVITIVRTNADGSRVVRKGRRYSRLQQGENATNRYLLVFDSPEPIQGVAFLIRHMTGGISGHWVHLPALQSRMRRVMGGGGGGILDTDFSVEDLAREDFSRFVYQRKGDLMYKKRPHFLVEAHPGKRWGRWPSSYGFRRIYVNREDFQISRIDYYDRQGVLLKTRTDKKASGKISSLSFRPESVRMENHQEGSNTVITTTKRYLNEELVPEKLFSRSKIEKGILLEPRH